MAKKQNAQSEHIGEALTFSATEAYKRLRTNIMFSLSNDKACRIIGITSAMRHEGKSTTSVNLSYSFAEAGKRVLLIDCDMRLPNVNNLLSIPQTPGLSNFLIGDADVSAIVQKTDLQKNLVVIASGDISPRPPELLQSKRFASLLEAMATKFDYIIIDLPPIDSVTDALIVSKNTDGMIMVTRRGYCDKKVLRDVMRQIRFHEVNMLGFVLTCADDGKSYYKSTYYKADYKSDEA